MKWLSFLLPIILFCGFANPTDNPAPLDTQLLYGQWRFSAVFENGVEDPDYMGELDSMCYVLKPDGTYQHGRMTNNDSVSVWFSGKYKVNPNKRTLVLYNEKNRVVSRFYVEQLTSATLVFGARTGKLRKNRRTLSFHLERVE